MIDPGLRSSPSDRSFDRRAFLALGAGAFVVSAIPLLRRDRPVVRRRIPVMGTLADITVVSDEQPLAQRAIGDACEALRAVEGRMSRFLAESDVGRANRTALQGWSPISAETAFVVAEALSWARRSRGAFDPALGGATELWDVTHRTTPPAQAAIEPHAARSLWREVELVNEGDRAFVRFHDPLVRLDLGGIAKGYAVDRAAAALRRHDIRNALVNVGGDLVALGRSPDGDRWRVGVADGADPTRFDRRKAFRLEDAAAATSGDGVRGFEHDGRRFHHLLDPRTGAPRVGSVRSITTIASDCVTADVAATALFGRTVAEARTIAPSWGVTVPTVQTSFDRGRPPRDL